MSTWGPWEVWNLKEMIQMNFCTKLSQTRRLREQTYDAGGRVWGRYSQGVWDGHVHTAIFNMDDQQGPTV